MSKSITTRKPLVPFSRTGLLAGLGAPDSATWHHWPTATVAVDEHQGMIWAALSRGAAVDDGNALLDLVAGHGYDGDGRPDMDLGDMLVWKMPIPVPAAA